MLNGSAGENLRAAFDVISFVISASITVINSAAGGSRNKTESSQSIIALARAVYATRFVGQLEALRALCAPTLWAGERGLCAPNLELARWRECV